MDLGLVLVSVLGAVVFGGLWWWVIARDQRHDAAREVHDRQRLNRVVGIAHGQTRRHGEEHFDARGNDGRSRR
jgi:hypothetical protein